MLNDLMKLLGLGQAQQQHQQAPQAPQRPQQAQAQAPDITYDPTGRTQYSARTPQLAQMGNQYVANPMDPRFQNVDPAQFGFPADNSGQNPYAFNPQPQAPTSSLPPALSQLLRR